MAKLQNSKLRKGKVKAVAYSITLLRANLKNHKYRRQSAVNGYKKCIKNKMPDAMRMKFFDDIRFRDQWIDDITTAINILNKK